MTNVLRTAYVNVAPNTDGFDVDLKEQLRRKDPGGKAGKLVGSQLNAALRRVNIDTIDIKANPKQALASIAVTEERLKALSRDSATVEVKVRTERALGELRRFRKQLGDIGGEAGPEAATGFFTKFSQKLGPLLAKTPLSSPLIATMAGAAVLAAPLIGATISGAVIGGAGLGGVVGGLVLASKDPRVKAAATQVGDRLKERLQAAGSSFVGPAIAGLGEIESAIAQINIEGILRDSAKFVQPLTAGISSALVDLGVGVEALIHNAGPVVDSIGRGIAAIGKSLGDGLASLADNGDAAANALDFVFSAIRTGVDAVFLVVNGLTEVYGFLKKIGALGVFGHLGEMMQDTGDKATGMAGGLQAAAVTATQLATAQKTVSASQEALQSSLDQVTGKMSQSQLAASALKTAMDNLYGASIRQTDANEAYQASWDGLSGSVKENGRTLNIHTAAGRTNRDALEGLLTSTNDLYIADVAAGVSIAAATRKHEGRIAAVKEEAKRVGLNKDATKDLIATYGQIPKKKTTDLLVSGVNAIVAALKDLYVFQRALADGIPVASEIAKLKGEKGPAKRYGGYATGGQIGGWSPNSKADNIPALLTAEEWVHPVDAVHYYGPQVMSAIQKRQVPRELLTAFSSGALGKMGDLPVFATGGQVAPVDTSKLMRFMTNASRTRVPSRGEVESKVPIGAGPGGAFARSQNGKPYIWADAGPAGYDCSGIVSAVYNVLHGRSPYSHTFSTSSLPGHWFPKSGIGGPLTAAWSNPGESPASSTTGHMMGMVNGLTFESSGGRGVHLGASTRRLTDFAHIAHYNQGGQVPFASYDSGGYLPPGISLAHNGTGRPEPVGGGGEVHFHFHDSVITSERQAVDLVAKAYKTAKKERKIP